MAVPHWTCVKHHVGITAGGAQGPLGPPQPLPLALPLRSPPRGPLAPGRRAAAGPLFHALSGEFIGASGQLLLTRARGGARWTPAPRSSSADPVSEGAGGRFLLAENLEWSSRLRKLGLPERRRWGARGRARRGSEGWGEGRGDWQVVARAGVRRDAATRFAALVPHPAGSGCPPRARAIRPRFRRRRWAGAGGSGAAAPATRGV